MNQTNKSTKLVPTILRSDYVLLYALVKSILLFYFIFSHPKNAQGRKKKIFIFESGLCCKVLKKCNETRATAWWEMKPSKAHIHRQKVSFREKKIDLKKKMEGNFYVSSSSVTVESKGKLAQAFLGCHEEADLYGKCVELAHANKELKRNSCQQERFNLRKCIDGEVLKKQQQQQQNINVDSAATATMEAATTTAASSTTGTKE